MKFHKNIVLLVFCLLTTACTDQIDKRIQEKAIENITKFRAEKFASCRAKLLAEAEKIADSLLLMEAKHSLEDSLLSGRPIRPAKPETIPVGDSNAIKPLFNK